MHMRIWLVTLLTLLFFIGCSSDSSDNSTSSSSSGVLQLSLNGASIDPGTTTQATLSLLDSNTTSSIAVSLSSANSAVATLSQNSCSLSVTNNSCTFNIAGVAEGNTTITASASGLTSVTAPVNVGGGNFRVITTYCCTALH